jgi:hypothetical protein
VALDAELAEIAEELLEQSPAEEVAPPPAHAEEALERSEPAPPAPAAAKPEDPAPAARGPGVPSRAGRAILMLGERISAPLDRLSPGARSAAGWVGVVTLLNALALWGFVLLREPAPPEPAGTTHAGETDGTAKPAPGSHAKPAGKSGHASAQGGKSGH